MKELKKALKDKAKKSGADLLGIASIDRFDSVKPDHHPASIFPGVKSVIVAGRRILRGSLRGIEEGTNIFDYQNYGHNWLAKQFIPSMIYSVVQLIEDNGWEAVPLYNYSTSVKPEGVPVDKGKPAPNVTIDFNHAAVAAGLGEIGYGNFFLSPQFGPRQRFGLILTDAELEPDPLFEGSICGKCMKCVEDCPINAIDSKNEDEITVAGRSYICAKVDYDKCKKCQNGSQENCLHSDGLPDRLGAICSRTCVHQLEQNKKVANNFENDFRVRSAWSVDEVGEIKTGGKEMIRVGCFDAGR